jgi:hypothetical protein
MTLPTVQKTWTFSVNNTRYYYDDTWDRRTVTYQIKEWLKSVGWTVRSSSNSSSVSNSGTDYWTSGGSLNYNNYNSARSWIVLRAPAAFAANFDIMLDCSNNGNGSGWSYNPTLMHIRSCQNGYNLNGTTSVRPTPVASPEHVYCWGGAGDSSYQASGGQFLGRSDWGYTYRWHAMSTSDQKQFRIFICFNGYCQTILLFERLDTVEAPSVWTEPVVMGVAAVGSPNHTGNYGGFNQNDPMIGGCASYTQYWLAGWCKTDLMRGVISGTNCQFYVSSEYMSSDPLAVHMGVKNEVLNEWPFYPAGLACGTTGKRGRQGMLTDLWLGGFGTWQWNAANLRWGVLDGETYPADGTRKFVQFGNLIVPWTGSAASPTSVPCAVW